MKVRSREAFKKSFLTLLEHKSIDRISVSEIIEKSGYSRSSFYRNFVDYYDFAEQLIREEANTLAGLLGDLMRDYSEKNELSRDILVGILQHVFAEQKMYHMIFSSRDFLPEYTGVNFAILVMNAFRARESFCFAADADVDEDFYRYSETLRFIRYLMFWDRKDYSLDCGYLADQILSMDRNDRTLDFLIEK